MIFVKNIQYKYDKLTFDWFYSTRLEWISGISGKASTDWYMTHNITLSIKSTYTWTWITAMASQTCQV